MARGHVGLSKHTSYTFTSMRGGRQKKKKQLDSYWITYVIVPGIEAHVKQVICVAMELLRGAFTV